MALIRIDYGALASSEVMNNNFDYLEEKITDVAESIITNNSGVYSNIASINNLIETLDNTARPIGQPLFRLDNTLFDDEVRLEGDEVSRTTYSDLFHIYGILYGAGDGVSTFILPDFRDRAIWGSNSFGYIAAGLPNITGAANFTDMRTSRNYTGAFYDTGLGGSKEGGGSNSNLPNLGFDASRSSSIYGNSSTVQPPAIKVRVVTRYK
ncbi:tail fiber protein [bacterium]|nr:tail fiber protein [bacterium]